MTLKSRIKAAIEAEIARQAEAPDNLRGLYFDDACSDGFRVIDGWLDLDALVDVVAAIAGDQALDVTKAQADEEQRQAARRSREGG